MDDTQDHPGNDDYFGALDFGDEVHVDGTESAIETLSEDSVESEEASDPDAEVAWQLATVSNPAETVAVTAFMSKEIQRVELSADVANMTEAELANEIRVIANLAQQRAESIFHSLMVQTFHTLGANDDQEIREFLEDNMKVSSPEQASEAQAEVFATRYASGNT